MAEELLDRIIGEIRERKLHPGARAERLTGEAGSWSAESK
jgi:hypothetical protein